MKKCKSCKKKITKDLRLLMKGFKEEYKDGLCVDCWVKKNKDYIVRAKAMISICK